MDDLLARFRRLDSGSISDALDRHGLSGGCLGIAPVCAGVKAVGRAFTVKYRVRGHSGAGTVGDFLDDVPADSIVVIDNAGRNYATVWGDIMTTHARARGVAGAVIDGVCRDVPLIRELAYPIFTRGVFMMTGKDRVEIDTVQSAVSVAGVSVVPGDFVLGDDSGVVVVPAAMAERIAKTAEEIQSTEAEILALLKAGSTLRDARRKLGYHALQSKSRD
ncbi:MAG: RraA family protein [Betaproteobacteria bacterium]